MAPSSSGKHKSWKETPARRADTQGSRTFARWMSLAVAVSLVALFAFVLWYWSRTADVTYFLAITTTEPGEQCPVTPLFEPQTQEGISKHNEPLRKYVLLQRLQDSSSIDGLAAEFEKSPARARDITVLYVSAPGVSQDDQPLLVGRDFDLSIPNKGRYGVRRLLEQLKKCKSDRKLLVLDLLPVAGHSRYGMLVNEFPTLLEKAITELDDDSIWVFVSYSQTELPLIDSARGVSVFGKTFLEGLMGHADLRDNGGNGNSAVSLNELFAYTCGRVRRITDGRQTPLLMRGGSALRGTVAPAELVVANLTPGWDDPPEAEAEEKKEDEKQDTSKSEDQPATGGGAAGASDTQNPGNAAAGGGGDAAGRPSAEGNPPAGGEAPAGDPPADSGTGAGDDPPEGTTESTGTGTTAAAAAQGDPAPQPPPPPDDAIRTDTDRLRAAIAEAWQLRDRLQRAGSSDAEWSPPEYAPHLWRELGMMLIVTEFRSRDAATYDHAILAGQIERHVTGLNSLAQAGDRPPSSLGALVVDHLLRSRSTFLRNQTARASFGANSPDVVLAGRAVRSFRRQAFLAPDYVRWQQLTAFLQGQDRQVDDVHEKLLDWLKRLATLGDSLRGLEGQQLANDSAARALLGEAEALEAIQGALHDAFLARASQTLNQRRSALNAQMIDALLATPLPNAELRGQLLAAALDPTVEWTTGTEAELPNPQSQPTTAQWWSRRQNDLVLEAAVIRLVDPGGSERFAERVAEAGRAPNSAASFEAFRKASDSLRKYYSVLPGNIKRNAEGSDEEMAQAEQWMLLVDPRDRVDRDVSAFPHLRILAPEAMDIVDIVVQDGYRLEREARPFSVTLNARRDSRREATVVVDFDERWITLTLEGRPIRNGVEERIMLGPRGEKQLDFEIAAKEFDTSSGRMAALPVEVRVTTPSSSPKTVLCQLPKPQEVDVFVDRPRPFHRTMESKGRVVLRPYPNRMTDYEFSLVNRSAEPRDVIVDIYAIPQQHRATWRRGQVINLASGQPFAEIRRSVFDDRTGELLDLKLIASTGKGPIGLRTDSEPLPIVLKAPGADDPPPAAPAGGDAAAAPPPPQPPGPELSSDGLVCVIRDANDSTWTRVKWIEFRAIAPAEMFELSSEYFPTPQRLDVGVKPKSAPNSEFALPDDLDPSPEKSMQVTWATHTLPRGVGGTTSGQFTRRNQPDVQMSVDLPPFDNPLEIVVDVAGFPRAFTDIIDRQSRFGNQGRPLDRTTSNYQITHVSMVGADRIYLVEQPRENGETFTPAWQPAEGDMRQPMTLAVGDAAKFKIDSDQSEPNRLVVGFKMDAPNNAFVSDLRGNYIELGINYIGHEKLKRYDDRQQVVACQAVNGRLAVDTKVTDYQLEMATNVKNRQVPVSLNLLLNGQSQYPMNVDVVLDGTGPQVTQLVVPPEVKKGEKLAITLEVEDLSGKPAKFEYGFVTIQAAAIPDGAAKTFDQFVLTESGRQWRAVIEVETAELPERPVWLKGKVIDQVGNETKLIPQSVKVVADMPTPPLKTANVIVQVGMKNFQPKTSDIKLWIKDKPYRAAPTGAKNGEFIFKGIPPGEYTIESSYFSGEAYEGSVTIVIDQSLERSSTDQSVGIGSTSISLKRKSG